MKRNLASKLVIYAVLFLFTWGCALPPWVSTVESDVQAAAPIAAALVAVVNPSLAPIATIVVAGINALAKVLDSYKAQPTATNLQSVQAAVNAINANMADLMAAAQIKNPTSDARVTAIVGLLAQLVNEVVAQVPSANPKAVRGATQAHGGAFYKDQFNAITRGDRRFVPIA